MTNSAACHPINCPEREKVETLDEIVRGNGKPEEGLAFRFGHVEKILRWLLGIAVMLFPTIIGCTYWIVTTLAEAHP